MFVSRLTASAEGKPFPPPQASTDLGKARFAAPKSLRGNACYPSVRQALQWTLFWDGVWPDRDTVFYFEAWANAERELHAMYVDLRAEQAKHKITLPQQSLEKQCVPCGHTRLAKRLMRAPAAASHPVGRRKALRRRCCGMSARRSHAHWKY